MKIAIAADHAGVDYKHALKTTLEEAGHEVTDFGTDSLDSCDYPDYAHPLANSIEKKETQMGVLICGSANGVAITANKHQDIRAALAWNTEVASLARQHNDANVVCIPARFIGLDEAKEVVSTFLNTAFEGGRHQKRVDKIAIK